MAARRRALLEASLAVEGLRTRNMRALAVTRSRWLSRATSPSGSRCASRSKRAPITPSRMTAVVWEGMNGWMYDDCTYLKVRAPRIAVPRL